MNRFAKAGARLANQTSDLELMKLDDVIRQFPDGVTMNFIELRESEEGNEYVVFTFLEAPGKYSSGSGDFLKFWEYALDEFGSSITDAQVYLKENPVRVKVWKTKTKSKRTYTKVKVLEDEESRERENEGSGEVANSLIP